MFNSKTRACIILALLVIESTSSISITGIIDARNPNAPSILLPGMKKSDLRSKGIFETFLHNLLDLLTTQFPGKKLPRYCRILSSSIYSIENKYAQRFAKHFKYMSRMYPEDLKKELLFYKDELNKRRPRRVEFLNAMNSLFTLQEYVLFDDYVYEVRNYGTDNKLFIDDETDKIVEGVIMGRIMELSSRDREDLQRKLRKAVKEFTDNWE
ncbi:unnamed protein product [Euphydryas editha]|uniref:Uncharacterized protein n=1 Tax=Euphydryas editha TaxID=104508 RepID=A0AAU9TRW8_EUPED|nr:unnamed protein product [Euphydryas editha]